MRMLGGFRLCFQLGVDEEEGNALVDKTKVESFLRSRRTSFPKVTAFEVDKLHPCLQRPFSEELDQIFQKIGECTILGTNSFFNLVKSAVCAENDCKVSATMFLSFLGPRRLQA